MRDQATQWVARLRSGTTDPDTLASFEAWLTADPRHRAAFDKASRVYRIRSGELLDEPAGRYHWRAAALMTAVALLLLVGLQWRDRVDERHLVTAKGDTRSLQLADGTELVLDADSELDVRITPFARTATLQRGQALFRVAHENVRSFEVAAEQVVTRANGAVYAVALRANEVAVSVVEGTVAVRDELGSASSDVPATQLLTVTRVTRAVTTKHDTDARSIAWLHGRLDVEEQALRDVIAELNRYVDRPILLGDDKLGELRVTGAFDPRRPDSFLESLALLRPIEIEHTEDGGRRLTQRP